MNQLALNETRALAGVTVTPLIVVPMDFTRCSREAVHTAVGYAQRFHARILLLHVIDIALDFLNSARADVQRIEEDIRKQAKDEFDWAQTTYRDTGIPFETLITEGLPGEQIVNIAEERNASMIVIGQHSFPRRWSLFHRHTVKEVLADSTCEVVVVTHKVPPKRKRSIAIGPLRRETPLRD